MNAKNKKAIEDTLTGIMKRDGTLEVDTVIEEAKNPESPLHSEFDWDVNQAAMEHWREQARRLIRSVEVFITVENHMIAVPAYVHDPSLPHQEQGFTGTVHLRTNKEQAMQALLEEVGRAESAIGRARRVASALGLEDEINALISAITRFRNTAKKKKAA